MNNTSSLISTSALCTATVVVAGLLCGCASSAQFSVLAERQGETTGSSVSYRLDVDAASRGAGAALAADAQVLRDVRTALSSRGMFEAPEGVAPALEIKVELGSGPGRQKVLTHAVPVYAEGSQPVSRSGEQRQAGASSEPMPRKIGEREVSRVVTVYPKYLRLTARTFRPEPDRGGGESAVLWSVMVTNEDESPDLAGYSRLMVAAAMDWIGRSTGAPAEIALSHRDRRVVFLAQGSTRAPHVAADTDVATVGRASADG